MMRILLSRPRHGQAPPSSLFSLLFTVCWLVVGLFSIIATASPTCTVPPFGNCTYTCGGSEIVDCPGGNCTQICQGTAGCQFQCSGGRCQQTCLDSSSRCTFGCSGQNCQQQCRNGGSCAFSCEPVTILAFYDGCVQDCGSPASLGTEIPPRCNFTCASQGSPENCRQSCYIGAACNMTIIKGSIPSSQQKCLGGSCSFDALYPGFASGAGPIQACDNEGFCNFRCTSGDCNQRCTRSGSFAGVLNLPECSFSCDSPFSGSFCRQNIEASTKCTMTCNAARCGQVYSRSSFGYPTNNPPILTCSGDYCSQSCFDQGPFAQGDPPPKLVCNANRCQQECLRGLCEMICSSPTECEQNCRNSGVESNCSFKVANPTSRESRTWCEAGTCRFLNASNNASRLQCDAQSPTTESCLICDSQLRARNCTTGSDFGSVPSDVCTLTSQTQTGSPAAGTSSPISVSPSTSPSSPVAATSSPISVSPSTSPSSSPTLKLSSPTASPTDSEPPTSHENSTQAASVIQSPRLGVNATLETCAQGRLGVALATGVAAAVSCFLIGLSIWRIVKRELSKVLSWSSIKAAILHAMRLKNESLFEWCTGLFLACVVTQINNLQSIYIESGGISMAMSILFIIEFLLSNVSGAWGRLEKGEEKETMSNEETQEAVITEKSNIDPQWFCLGLIRLITIFVVFVLLLDSIFGHRQVSGIILLVVFLLLVVCFCARDPDTDKQVETASAARIEHLDDADEEVHRDQPGIAKNVELHTTNQGRHIFACLIYAAVPVISQFDMGAFESNAVGKYQIVLTILLVLYFLVLYWSIFWGAGNISLVIEFLLNLAIQTTLLVEVAYLQVSGTCLGDAFLILCSVVSGFYTPACIYYTYGRRVLVQHLNEENEKIMVMNAKAARMSRVRGDFDSSVLEPDTTTTAGVLEEKKSFRVMFRRESRTGARLSTVLEPMSQVKNVLKNGKTIVHDIYSRK